jgi:hypothetical protein
MFMSDDSPLPTSAELAESTGPRRRHLTVIDQDGQHVRNSLARYGGYLARVRGASHANFCDSPLYTPIKRLTETGPIDVTKAMKIINHYTLDFFSQSLMGERDGVLEYPISPYPEVRLESWPPPAR